MLKTFKHAWYQWTPPGRALVFLLAATSIESLLAEFYGLSSMRTFTLCISLPALALLILMAVIDSRSGDGRLARALWLGSSAGLLAALAYDLFRLPFVFSKELGLSALVPQLPLFKVFSRFGALLLGQPLEQAPFSLSAQAIGWAYHFSNGITFGIMYLAAVGDPAKRHWLWAVFMAIGLELGMLFTPYPRFFGIHPSAVFITVTLCAHLIFGVVLGLRLRPRPCKP